MRTRNLIFTALIGVAVTAPGVSAQTGNQSDVTGALVTSFIGSAFSGTSITLTGAQSLAIMNAMNALDLGLQGNTLVSSTGLPLTLSSAFRAALNEILSSPTPSNEAKAALAAALMTMAGGSSATSSGSGVVSAPWPYAGIGTGAVRSAALDEATDELIAALSGLFAAFGRK